MRRNIRRRMRRSQKEDEDEDLGGGTFTASSFQLPVAAGLCRGANEMHCIAMKYNAIK